MPMCSSMGIGFILDCRKHLSVLSLDTKFSDHLKATSKHDIKGKHANFLIYCDHRCYYKSLLTLFFLNTSCLLIHTYRHEFETLSKD